MKPIYYSYKDRVQQLIRYYKDRDGLVILSFVLLIFAKMMWNFYQVLAAGKGFPQSDDSRWYLDYARSFVANLTDGLDMNDVLYFGYNFLLSLLITLFRDPIAVIILQIIALSLSVVLVYKIAAMLFNRTTAIIAAFLYCINYDIVLWSLYILSDSFFVCLLLLCVYLLLQAIESGEKKYTLYFIAAAVYMLFFRPTGIAALGFMLLYMVIRMPSQTMALLHRYRWVIGGCLAIMLAGGFVLLTSDKSALLFESLQFNAKKVLYNVYAKGWIYDRPCTYDYFFRPNYRIDIWNSLTLSFIINNWDHVSTLYVRRAIAFLGRWAWEANFTTWPGIIRFLEASIPTVLFIVGTIAAIKNKLFRKASILWLLVLSVFLFCVVIFIDWMYRYKLPAIPFIVIIAAYGTERVLSSAWVIAKKLMEMLPYGQGKDIGRYPRL